MESFARLVLQRRTNHDCEEGINSTNSRAVPPLLMHMNDYLGNVQRGIWATTQLSQDVHVLANYYGFSSMSYADVVRDLVYGNTHESWFSPKGWWERRNGYTPFMSRELHPGMGMHVTAAWVATFTMLHLTTTYCSLEWSLSRNSSLAPTWHNDSEPFYYYDALTLPKLMDRHYVPGKPRRPPRDFLPPRLTKELSLENITEVWRNQSSDDKNWTSSFSEACHEKDSTPRCPFSWISGLIEDQTKRFYALQYFRPRTISNEGWNFDQDHNKLGFTARRHANMTLEFKNLSSNPIRTVVFFVMKSYGPKWSNSRVQITATS